VEHRLRTVAVLEGEAWEGTWEEVAPERGVRIDVGEGGRLVLQPFKICSQNVHTQRRSPHACPWHLMQSKMWS
jgi:hypothetical protein